MTSEDPFEAVKRGVAAAPEGQAKSKAEGEPVAPVPAGAPAPLAGHRAHGQPSRVWTYRDAGGQVLGYVARFDKPDGSKVVLPLSLWCEAGKLRWAWKAFAEPRPLYGLQQLAERPGAPALVVEGEKTVEAARERLTGFAVASWPGGSKATGKVDWSPLAGRDVVVWPDHDDAGRKAAQEVARLASAAGALSVSIVEVPAYFPDAWDLADDWPGGFDRAKAAALIEAARAAAQPAGVEWPWGFEMTPEGLVFEQASGNGGKPVPVRISGPFEVLAEGRDIEGGGWAILLRFKDRDGREHTVAVSKGRLAAGGAEVRAELADAGLMISPARGKADKFAIALMEVRVARRVTLASATGWLGHRYVLPREVIGPAGAEAVHYTAEAASVHYRRAGSLVGWRDGVAALAPGNDLLTFCLSAAFLGPLLRPLDWEGGGLHLRGSSSCGKSTLQQAAGSVWGGGGAKGFVQDWRMTGNALEMLAYSHNDNVLILDELKQIAAEEAGNATYMLASGQAKARARADGSLRRRAEWRVFVLSSGELSLADHVASGRKGERAFAGQELRLIDVAADMGLRNADGSPMGVWQELHGHASSWAASTALDAATKRDFGHAGPAFLAALTSQRDAALTQAAELRAAFLAGVAQEGDTGQARRGAEKFAAVAVAGELAAIFGVLPWPIGMASDAARRLYARWVSTFGRDRSREAGQIIRQVRGVIESEAAAFAPLGDDAAGEEFPTVAGRDEQARGLKAYGYRRVRGTEVEYWFNDVGWEYAVSGFGRQDAARALHEAGFLDRGDGDHWKRRQSVRGRKVRFWTVKAAILEADLGD